MIDIYYRVYNLIKNKDVIIQNSSNNEIFISCISFEDRSQAVLKYFHESVKFEVGFFLINQEVTNNREVKKKMEQLQEIYRSHFKTIIIDIIPKNMGYLETASHIYKSITSKLNSLTFDGLTIDITTFKRYHIIFLLYILNIFKTPSRFFYISPLEYGDWQTDDFSISESLPLVINKEYDPRKKSLLLIILGFEINRAINLIDDLSPDKVIFGRTNPPISANYKIIQDSKIEEGLKFVVDNFSEDRILNFHGYDIKKLEKQIEEVLENYRDEYNLFISIMGPKIQIIAFYLQYNKKNIINYYYNSALNYNIKTYSYGAEKLFVYKLNNSFELMKFGD